jgi:hypothetical protein
MFREHVINTPAESELHITRSQGEGQSGEETKREREREREREGREGARMNGRMDTDG